MSCILEQLAELMRGEKLSHFDFLVLNWLFGRLFGLSQVRHLAVRAYAGAQRRMTAETVNNSVRDWEPCLLGLVSWCRYISPELWQAYSLQDVSDSSSWGRHQGVHRSPNCSCFLVSDQSCRWAKGSCNFILSGQSSRINENYQIRSMCVRVCVSPHLTLVMFLAVAFEAPLLADWCVVSELWIFGERV